MNPLSRELQKLDKAHVWHPFTQMQDWCAPGHEPLVLVRGQGCRLWDSEGSSYLDGNSSIWTNIHGHGHPAIVAALRDQLEKTAHTSFLGFTNEPAIRLATELVNRCPGSGLERVFYTDDGSTAIECAVRMALQYFHLAGQPERVEFAAFDQAYHGDTLGAASLGGISTFQAGLGKSGLPTRRVFGLADLQALSDDEAGRLAAVIIEPLVQGAAGMRLWPGGLLRGLREWCDHHGVLLIFDEVMTGFGRTGKLFACQHEETWPDFLCLAKGLTGGTLPLAATLTTSKIYSAFLGRYDELKTLFYGHSYCGNALGCAAALASLRVFKDERVLDSLPEKISLLSVLLAEMQARLPRHVAAIRQCGLIAGIDIVRDTATGEAFPWQEQTGARICHAARAHGLLTRPVRDTLVLMPPLCITPDELRACVHALTQACLDVLK